jgi:hypothetical protein
MSMCGMPCLFKYDVCCTVASELAAKGSVEVSKHTLQVSLTPRRLQQQSGGEAAGGCGACGVDVQIIRACDCKLARLLRQATVFYQVE